MVHLREKSSLLSEPAKFVSGALGLRVMKALLQGIPDDLRNGLSFRRGPDSCSLIETIIRVECGTHVKKHMDTAELCQSHVAGSGVVKCPGV